MLVLAILGSRIGSMGIDSGTGKSREMLLIIVAKDKGAVPYAVFAMSDGCCDALIVPKSSQKNGNDVHL